MLDHGYAQSTNTDSLKHRVHNEPGGGFFGGRKNPSRERGESRRESHRGDGVRRRERRDEHIRRARRRGAGHGRGHGRRAHRRGCRGAFRRLAPRDGESDRDEIFVDVVEKVNVVFGADGTVAAQDVDGTIRVRNFLHGDPASPRVVG